MAQGQPNVVLEHLRRIDRARSPPSSRSSGQRPCDWLR